MPPSCVLSTFRLSKQLAKDTRQDFIACRVSFYMKSKPIFKIWFTKNISKYIAKKSRPLLHNVVRGLDEAGKRDAVK